MRLSTKVSLIITLLTLLACGGAAYLSYASHLKLAADAENRELRTLATFIQNDLQAQSDKAAARASLICSLPSIQEAFRAGDREQLARRLVPAFLVQRDKFGVREGQFHTPPATSFLRLYDTANFGEDLSSFREMVLATNRRQEPQKGVEIGRQGLSIRGIDVLKDAQGPIGSFEVGISFSTVMTDIKNNFGFEAGAYVDNALMTSIATLAPKPDAEHIVGEYQNVESTNWQVIRQMVTPDLLAKVNDVTFRSKNVNGVDYGLVLLPLLDYKGKQIGALVAVGSFETVHTQLMAALTGIVSTALFQAILLIGMSLLIIKAMFLRPVRALGEKIAELANGKIPEKSPALSRRHDEIGEAARQLEKFEYDMTETPTTNVEEKKS